MNLVFVSNMLNHHQMELCRELQKNFEDFCFIATEKTDNIGYQKSQNADFVLHYYETEEQQETIKCIVEADVVIFGSCPDQLIEERMRLNKLSFLYSERFFKKGIWRSLVPTIKKAVINRIGKYKGMNLYVLCASAYLPYDLSLIGYPVSKCYKWGYFPEVRHYDINSLIEKKKTNSILWAGRLLDWKHPEMAVTVAESLVKDNIQFEMNIIGDGPLKEKIESLITNKQLDTYVHLLGHKTPEEVRNYMEATDIFLATSDFYEGWGAVLNEAMNSACGVVASHATGATPYLVDDGKNGQVFISGNVNMLCQKVKTYMAKREFLKNIQRKAYETINETWNAKSAASSFKKLVDSKIDYDESTNALGPCSKASVIKNNWYRGKVR